MEYKKTIDFIGMMDNKLYTFKTMRNPLSGNQMYWIEQDTVMYVGTVREAKRHVKLIHKNCKVLSELDQCKRAKERGEKERQ